MNYRYRNTMYPTREPIAPLTIFLAGVNVGAWGFVIVHVLRTAS